jgi:hypothetical protein
VDEWWGPLADAFEVDGDRGQGNAGVATPSTECVSGGGRRYRRL